MALRLNLSFGFISLITVYSPTDACKLNMKEMFYAKLASRCDIRIVLGNFDMVFSCERFLVLVVRELVPAVRISSLFMT